MLLKNRAFHDELHWGYASGIDNLGKTILLRSNISLISVLAEQVRNHYESPSFLEREKERVEGRLNRIQNGLITQYSDLNRTLFQLSSTS